MSHKSEVIVANVVELKWPACEFLHFFRNSPYSRERPLAQAFLVAPTVWYAVSNCALEQGDRARREVILRLDLRLHCRAPRRSRTAIRSSIDQQKSHQEKTAESRVINPWFYLIGVDRDSAASLYFAALFYRDQERSVRDFAGGRVRLKKTKPLVPVGWRWQGQSLR